MTDKEEVEDAVERLFKLIDNQSSNWFQTIPILIVTSTDIKTTKELVINSLLKWLPEAHMNDHTSGFIIQHRTIFNKWYETLKLNTQNDTSTTHSVT
jgi:hypothetical protein